MRITMGTHDQCHFILKPYLVSNSNGLAIACINISNQYSERRGGLAKYCPGKAFSTHCVIKIERVECNFSSIGYLERPNSLTEVRTGISYGVPSKM